MTDIDAPGGLLDADEIVPDYSRLGFRQLRDLCKSRQIPADGTGPQLIDKLKAWDAQHGREVDTTLPDGDDLDDLLADDNPTHVPSSPEPTDKPGPTAPEPTAHQLAAPAPARPAETPTGGGGDASPTPPPDGNAPAAMLRAGHPNLAVPTGVVTVGEGSNAQHGAVQVRAYRAEYVVGDRDITDQDHFGFLERTHEAAQAAGYATKGGITIGERVGYGMRDGQRTAIYQVPLRRQ